MRFTVICITLTASLLAAGTAVAQSPQFRLLKLGNSQVQWVMPSSKDGSMTLTYSTIDAAEVTPDAFNCQRITAPDAMLARSKISYDAWRAEVRAAFDLWQSVTRITFVEAPRGASANIKIGAQVDPAGRAFTNVAYDAHAVAEPKPITQSVICLNPKMPWKIGFDGNLSVYDIRYTIAHEIGHAIGLDHPTSSGVMMGFRYDEHFRDLQAGDVAGIQALYGAPTVAGNGPEAPISISLTRPSQRPSPE